MRFSFSPIVNRIVVCFVGNSYLFVSAFLIVLFNSCSDKKVEIKQYQPKEFAKCAYVPDNEELKDLDSLTRRDNYKKLDLNYKKISQFNIDDQLFLVNLMIMKNENLRKFELVDNFLIKGDSIILSNDDINVALKAWYYSKKAGKFEREYAIDSSMKYHHKALAIYDEINGDNCLEKLTCYGSIGITHVYFKGNLDTALHYLKKQEKSFENSIGVDDAKYTNYYIQSTIYRKIHNYALGLTYANLTISILKNKKDIDSSELSKAYFSKANILYRFKHYSESIECYKNAIDINQKMNSNSRNLILFYSGIINVLSYSKRTEESDKYIDLLFDLANVNTSIMARAMKHKAYNYIQKKDYDLAKKYYQKTIKLFESIEKPNLVHLSDSYYFYSLVLRELKEYQLALKNGEKAIKILFKMKNPDFENLSKDSRSINFQTNLASIYSSLNKENNNKRFKELAQQKFNLVDSLAKYFNNYSDEDVVITNQTFLDVYFDHRFRYHFYNYKILHEENQLKQAINVINKYKNQSLLRERLLGRNDFTNERKKIKHEIEEIKFLIEEEKGNADSLIVLLNKKLRQMDSISTVQPITDFKSINLFSELTKYCKKNKVLLIDYFFPEGNFSNNDGFVFVSDGNHSKIYPVNDLEMIFIEADNIRNLLSSYDKDTKIINSLSSSLYKKILFFLDDFHDFKSIIIIPDKSLQKVPFEILSEKKDDNSMLIHEYDISYGFSMQNLLMQKNKSRINKKNIIAFAYSDPSTIIDRNTSLVSELPGSYNEVQIIKKIYGKSCKIFTGKSSTKDNFFKYAEDYRMIHLALHGKANVQSRFKSSLYFRDKDSFDLLYPHELQKYRIRPQLLLLSACETAKGKTYDHESMYSIARAFYAGGAEQVISSLWDLDDESTTLIVKYFYKIIYDKPEMSYSKALRQAKLKYIKQIKNPTPALYSLWSGMILYQ